MNVDTDTQYAFTRPVVDHIFKNYDGMLKVDGEVGNKKAYDPRAWGKAAEAGMAARIVEACENLRSAGHLARRLTPCSAGASPYAEKPPSRACAAPEPSLNCVRSGVARQVLGRVIMGSVHVQTTSLTCGGHRCGCHRTRAWWQPPPAQP